jgi:hypothetical protein
MILTKEINVGINYLNFEHYKNIGFDVKYNNKLIIPIEYLQKESNLKIDVKCDICDNKKTISYQKYNKNIDKYGIYTCSVICSQFKIKATNLKKYGNENYVNTLEIKKRVKEKYDIITTKIKENGYINCIKCNNDRSLNNFLIKNGRYKHICLKCRCEINSYNRRKRNEINPDLEKNKQRKNYEKNKHIHAWRNLLKNFLNRKNLKKENSTHQLLGYSHEQLKTHLESLFIENMSWKNYGKWQIDHIVHVSYFKEDTSAEIVNSLENLRPYFDNSSRNNKLDEDCKKLMTKFTNYLKIDYI